MFVIRVEFLVFGYRGFWSRSGDGSLFLFLLFWDVFGFWVRILFVLGLRGWGF